MTYFDYDHMCLAPYDVKREMIHCCVCKSYYISKQRLKPFVKKESIDNLLNLFVDGRKESNAIPDEENEKVLYCNFNGICRDCADKKRDSIVLNYGHVLMQYLSLVSELSHSLQWRLYREFLSNLSAEVLDVINHKAYIEIKNFKHFGIKRLKRQLAEYYVKSSRENIIKYIQEVVSKRVISNKIEQLLNLEKKVIRFLDKCDDEIPVYEAIGYDNVCRSRERTPFIVGITGKFYKEIVRYKKDEILKIINGIHEFEVPMFEKEVYGKILERMPVTMSKMDIWN